MNPRMAGSKFEMRFRAEYAKGFHQPKCRNVKEAFAKKRLGKRQNERTKLRLSPLYCCIM
jgi:hypothetical protein